jgi:hypothetical protein
MNEADKKDIVVKNVLALADGPKSRSATKIPSRSKRSRACVLRWTATA